MAKFAINKSAKIRIRQAARSAVEDFLEARPRSEKSRKWILQKNRYRRSCTGQYEEDIESKPSQVKDAQLLAYVGASAPCHAIDGWSFLGRAVDSALRGDTYSATHFGYYAELRAAMSLLGAEGIGVFNGVHAVIDNAGIVHRFPPIRGKQVTHQVIWPVLKFWTSLERAKDVIDFVVAPNDIRLSDWLGVAGGQHNMRALAAKWLSFWGLDLAALDSDHDRRNLVSYRPSEFRKARADVRATTQFVEELWNLFEPSQDVRFPLIGNFLLRRAWRQLSCGKPQQQRLMDLGLNEAEAQDWLVFLDSKAEDPLPIALATQVSSIENSLCHLQVIARATLLLFVASASARKLLADASYTEDDLAFWWKQYGADRGLWPMSTSPGDKFEPWADIAQQCQASSRWRADRELASSSFYDWRLENPQLPTNLGAMELLGIWSLLP